MRNEIESNFSFDFFSSLFAEREQARLQSYVQSFLLRYISLSENKEKKKKRIRKDKTAISHYL